MSRRALIGAGVTAALLLITWMCAFHVALFVRADQSIFRGFLDLQRPGVDTVANFVAHLCNPSPYVYFAALPPLIALLRRRVRAAVAVGAMILGANVTTQLLKPLLAQPRAHGLLDGYASVASASWPSGHATAAMALALAFVLVVPARWRPAVAAIGAAFAVAVSYSFLTLGWHYPSDVFGGYLVSATWTLLAAAAVRAADRPAPGRWSLPDALTPPVVAMLAAAGLAVLAVVVRRHGVIAFARAHHAFMIGAPAIAALAMTLPIAVTLITGSGRAPRAARRRDSHPG